MFSRKNHFVFNEDYIFQPPPRIHIKKSPPVVAIQPNFDRNPTFNILQLRILEWDFKKYIGNSTACRKIPKSLQYNICLLYTSSLIYYFIDKRNYNKMAYYKILQQKEKCTKTILVSSTWILFGFVFHECMYKIGGTQRRIISIQYCIENAEG